VRFVRQEGLTRRFATALAIGVAVALADQWMKHLAETTFASDPVQIIPGVLTFTFTENPGMAFSLLQGGGTFLGVAAIGAILFVLWVLRSPRPTIEVVAFGFILGGAAGNLIDRIVRGSGLLDGHVIDWIQFPNFPVFNLADAAVNVAVGLLLIGAWIHRDREKGTSERAPA
jgi:signal peptidase II